MKCHILLNIRVSPWGPGDVLNFLIHVIQVEVYSMIQFESVDKVDKVDKLRMFIVYTILPTITV